MSSDLSRRCEDPMFDFSRVSSPIGFQYLLNRLSSVSSSRCPTCEELKYMHASRFVAHTRVGDGVSGRRLISAGGCSVAARCRNFTNSTALGPIFQ
jgi:hypothetical protein